MNKLFNDLLVTKIQVQNNKEINALNVVMLLTKSAKSCSYM